MQWMRALILGVALLGAGAHATSQFPALTGRVVDDAHILTAPAQQSLTQQLAQLEAQNGDQLVVVTVPSLNGESIEDYGVALGRYWGIGQKGKNNGVLLIVAPKERKVRIEVGYGLEGTLTDAVCSQIIQTIILPQFRQGNMGDGILQGAHAIMMVVNGGALPGARGPAHYQQHSDNGGITLLVVGFIALLLFSQMVLFVFYLVGSVVAFILSLFGFNAFSRWLAGMKARIFPADLVLLQWLLTPTTRLTGSGGGGFSGGGGSFGGGGGSGGW